VGQSLDYGLIGDPDGVMTTAGVYYPDGGVAFLLREFFPHDATVYAFRACYRNQNPIRFQIWRPTTNNSYRFIAEVVRYFESGDILPALETVRAIRPMYMRQ